MKKFIREYLRVIAYTATGLVFGIASFYLLMNYYHSEEVSKPLYISQNDVDYTEYKTKISKIDENLKRFDSMKSKNDELKTMYSKLISCRTVMDGDKTLSKLKVDNYFKPVDIYQLGSSFQSEVLNICWAMHLSYLTSDTPPVSFKEYAPYISSSVKSITNQINFALDEIQNNSSYFYTTNITSSTIRNYLKSDYSIITDSYNEFADIVLELSESLNEKAGEIND